MRLRNTLWNSRKDLRDNFKIFFSERKYKKIIVLFPSQMETKNLNQKRSKKASFFFSLQSETKKIEAKQSEIN
jgi:hypothetical protein